MSEGNGGSVESKLEGAHLRVDARPARLVSLLRSAGGDPVVTAQRQDGGSHTEAVPAAARQVTFQVDRELSVEATRGSDFVALSEASGRQVVVAFNGEVTVLPKGESGDRFALGAHEALLVPADGSEPRVVPSDDLSDEDQDEISGAMEAAALGVTAQAPAPAEAETAAATGTAAAASAPAPAKATPAPVKAGAAKKAPATAAAAGSGAATPPRAGNAAKKGKKGKRGRPQPQTKKAAPLVPAAGAAGAAGAAAAAGSAKKSTPVKKAAAPAKKAPAGKLPAKGGGHADDSYADTPGDRRFILGAVAVAAVIAVVLAIFVLRGGDDGATDVAADGTTTSAQESTTAPPTTAAAPSTTAAPAPSTSAPAAVTSAAPTTAARPTTTTAAPTTTTARATTTTAAPAAAVKYGIEPKSCVQNANRSITYTAAIKNDSTAAFDYTIRVVFKDAKGASVASTDATVTRLAAGQTVDFTATGTPNRDLTNAGQCTVERVDARPSGS